MCYSQANICTFFAAYDEMILTTRDFKWLGVTQTKIMTAYFTAISDFLLIYFCILYILYVCYMYYMDILCIICILYVAYVYYKIILYVYYIYYMYTICIIRILYVFFTLRHWLIWQIIYKHPPPLIGEAVMRATTTSTLTAGTARTTLPKSYLLY